MFKLMDIDNDGKITYEELKAGLRKVGSQLAELEIKMLMEVVSLLRPKNVRYYTHMCSGVMLFCNKSFSVVLLFISCSQVLYVDHDVDMRFLATFLH